MASTSGLQAQRTCRHCSSLFTPGSGESCYIHAGSWAGFERGKLYGGRTDDFPHADKVVYHWDCCGQTKADARGCVERDHESFDGESSERLPGS
mmetsp:Transcript_12819/g.43408  ORF Transcript_12819/g.43408 Transcript_12819/m.43408 type:complete len:94 (-) Transcript_12819:196-477(-)